MRDGKRDGKDKVEGGEESIRQREGTQGSAGSSHINVSDRGRGEYVYRAKCLANIPDRRAGGGGQAQIKHAEVCLLLVQTGEKHKNFSVSFIIDLYFT